MISCSNFSNLVKAILLASFFWSSWIFADPMETVIPTTEQLKNPALLKKKKLLPKKTNPSVEFDEESNFKMDEAFFKANSLTEFDAKPDKFETLDKILVAEHSTMTEEDLPPEGPPPKLEIIVDASGSMGQLLNSNRTKMYYLKKMLTRFFGDQWKEHDLTGLRVYGSRRRNDCDDNYLPVGFSDKSLGDVEKKVATLFPIGRTPIYKSVKDAIDDIKKYKGPKAIAIFTDGEETCGGDPCKLTKETKLSQMLDIKFFVVAIGFPPGVDSLKKVSCIGDTQVANNDQDLFKALGNISDSVNKNRRNLRVISPNPSASVELFQIIDGKPEFFRTFTAAWGITVPPGEYEAVVALEPNYRFPRFKIPPHKVVTLQVFGQGTIDVKYSQQILDVEVLDKNQKAVATFTSDKPTLVPIGNFKLRVFKDPFFSKLIQPIIITPEGKIEYDATDAGTVQVNYPELVGLYVYDSRDKLMGNYLTNTPFVLPRGEYRIHVNERCSFDKVSVVGLARFKAYDCKE